MSLWSEKGCNAIRIAIFVYEMGALLVTSAGPVAYFSCYDLMKRLKELLRFAISGRSFSGRYGWGFARIGGKLLVVNGRLHVLKRQ